MRLLPIPGAPGYRVDCENQEVYNIKKSIKKLKTRTVYKSLNLRIDGHAIPTTVFRLMYCAQNGIDVTKIPPHTCIGLYNGVATVVSRTELQKKRHITIKERNKNLEKWRVNYDLIIKYYKGNTLPLLNALKKVEIKVKLWYIERYGLSNERAEIVAAYGVNKYLDRLAEGCPTPYIFSSVLRHARTENKRMSYQRHYIDDMEVIEL